MAIDPRQIELSPEMKLAIARKAEQTGKPWDEILWHAIESAPHGEPVRGENGQGDSFYDAMRDLVGIVKGGPADLSVNPKYLEGFGHNRPGGGD
jgi:hypothetical protein